MLLLRLSLLILGANTASAQQDGVTTSGTTSNGVRWEIIEDDDALPSGSHMAVPQSNGPALWVIDTQTGAVKLCWPVSVEGGYAVQCTEADQ